MCVIIVKEPNVVLPFDKIESACRVNPDGFGISIVDTTDSGVKYLKSFKNYLPTGNDAYEVYDIIEKNNHLLQFIHLRFSTQGVKSVANCHPFTLLDTIDGAIEFMHNGTLYGLPKGHSDDDSDTVRFVDHVASPLAEAFAARNGINNVVNDPAFSLIMEEFTGNGIFVAYDNQGNYSIHGGKGFAHEGWWSSNVYSFNDTHRTPAKSTVTKSTYTNGSYLGDRWDDDSGEWEYTDQLTGITKRWDDKLQKMVEVVDANTVGSSRKASLPTMDGGSIVPFDSDSGDHEGTKEKQAKQAEEAKILGYALSQAKKAGVAFKNHTPPVQRSTFLELSGLSSMEEVMLLDEEEIEHMVEQCPAGVTLLVMDLLFELYVERKKPAQTKEKKAA